LGGHHKAVEISSMRTFEPELQGNLKQRD